MTSDDGTNRAEPIPDDGVDLVIWFRWLVVFLQATTIVVTWPLWQVREISADFTPPNLPLLPMWQFDIGWIMIASLAVVFFRPLPGVALHSLLLLLAITQDQIRLQPEFVSLTILMWGTLQFATSRFLCRAHLFSLWFYSGFHKLLSSGYWERSGRSHWQKVFPHLDDSPATVLAVMVAAGEVMLALLVLSQRTRKPAAWIACFLHLGVFTYLLSSNWNVAVWFWNLALAMAGFALIASWDEPLRLTIKQNRPTVNVAALLLIVAPLGYYFGLTDPYLSHCLYSSNTPKAWLQRAEDETRPKKHLSQHSLATIHVPIPPQHRLFEQYFHLAGKPGDRLIIYDPRRWAKKRDLQNRTLTIGGESRKGEKHQP